MSRVRGEHQHRHIRLRADVPQGLEPVHARHRHIEHDEVNRFVLKQRQRFRAAARRQHRHLRGFEL